MIELLVTEPMNRKMNIYSWSLQQQQQQQPRLTRKNRSIECKKYAPCLFYVGVLEMELPRKSLCVMSDLSDCRLQLTWTAHALYQWRQPIIGLEIYKFYYIIKTSIK